jgi:flagellar biosynthesis chaperone FliJ
MYQHEFEQEESYLNTVEHQNVEISASAWATAERQCDDLEEEIARLKNIIDDLDNKLDHVHENRPVKCPHAHDPSLEQEWPV